MQVVVYIPKRISVISSHSIVVTFDTANGDVPQIFVPRQADNSSTFTEFAYSVGVS